MTARKGLKAGPVKRNPQDATLRNIRALKAQVARLQAARIVLKADLYRLQARVVALEAARSKTVPLSTTLEPVIEKLRKELKAYTDERIKATQYVGGAY